MLAVALLMKMKGHNGIKACQSCNIKGLRVPGADAKVHYLPLDHSTHPNPGAIRVYDPRNLPMRTNKEFKNNMQSVVTARTCVEEDRLAKSYGIKGKTVLSTLDSLSFPHSFLYNFMHLMYENTLKNLILFWTNEFKDLGPGIGNYVLSSIVCDTIGAATAKSCDLIPSVYSA